MGGWRSKLIFLLIVYFAGFATAIYCLAPVTDKAYLSNNKGFAHSALKSDKFAKSFNSKMRKYLGYSEDAAKRASTYLKQKRGDKHKALIAKE
jgi:flagellar biosynthesis protein FliP